MTSKSRRSGIGIFLADAGIPDHMKIRIWIGWAVTGLMAALMLLSAVPDVLRVPGALAVFEHLGYPPYLLLFVGTAKILGVAVVLAPHMSRLKEWAFAGLTSDSTGAGTRIYRLAIRRVSGHRPRSAWR